MDKRTIKKLQECIDKKDKYNQTVKILKDYIDLRDYSRTCSIDRGSLRHKLGTILRDKFDFSPSQAADAAMAFVDIWWLR